MIFFFRSSVTTAWSRTRHRELLWFFHQHVIRRKAWHFPDPCIADVTRYHRSVLFILSTPILVLRISPRVWRKECGENRKLFDICWASPSPPAHHPSVLLLRSSFVCRKQNKKSRYNSSRLLGPHIHSSLRRRNTVKDCLHCKTNNNSLSSLWPHTIQRYFHRCSTNVAQLTVNDPTIHSINIITSTIRTKAQPQQTKYPSEVIPAPNNVQHRHQSATIDTGRRSLACSPAATEIIATSEEETF